MTYKVPHITAKNDVYPVSFITIHDTLTEKFTFNAHKMLVAPSQTSNSSESTSPTG